MALWPCSSPSKASDVSAELDDIIKRLAQGDTSSDISFESHGCHSSSIDNNNETDPGKVKCQEKCEAVLGSSENAVESRAENVCGVLPQQRSPRPSSELAPTINTDDVRSRDACLETACSAGSYARRKHEKRHKHRHRSSSPEPPEDLPKAKINPVFVWVRQENCRIVEVMCEDYDKRNRLRIAKTPLGWRAIPKTEVFSSAVIPKAPKPPKTERRRKHKKSSKKKRRKSRSHCDDDKGLKECSVSLTRTETEAYNDDVNNEEEEKVEKDDSEGRILEEVREEMCEYKETLVSKMTKSSSCDFKAIASKPAIVRSSSLNFSITATPEVQKLPEHSELGIKMEEDAVDKVLDMTKHGELNDNDCDELGMLLKEIPDLEFVEEEDINGNDEFEEFGLPKDLTLPKIRDEPQKMPQLPPNISSLVTVTSSTRPPQPLTAPLPEVTITPIPNPKPAHQHKLQNKYLESLLSASRNFKPESSDVLVTKSKPLKRPHEGGDETRAKNIKLEDITLKSLLNKQNGHEKGLTTAEVKSRLSEMLMRGEVDPIAQLKQVLSNPELAVPDPLLVPRARLPALVASPASEIPRLLKEKKIAEPPPPMADPDTLVVSLSHLRSLLSYKCNNTQDLSTYQKSLEAFLEWQRYQTELMEAQVKASAPLTPGDIDMATANAFNQMLWLPYLNQLDSNRDLMGFLNTVCSPYGQSSPFLTPTSPMEGHMKTLAMWQEAIMAQQNANMKLPSPSPPEHKMKVAPPSTPPRKKTPNQMYRPPRYDQMLQQQAHFEFRRQQEQQHRLIQQRHQQQRQQEKMARQRLLMQHQQQQQHQQMYQMQQMQQNYNNFHDDISKQLKLDLDKKDKTPPPLKPLPNLIDRKEVKKSSSWCQFEEDLKKSAELTNQMARQWQLFEEEMRKSQIQISKNQKKIKSETKNEVLSESWPLDDRKPVDTKPDIKVCDSERVSGDSPVPKLKVKNLVDPNMSPPKLLKVAPPDHLLASHEVPTLSDDPQGNLWHPLFGSNQAKNQSYSSPWRWTTVTVNGE